VPWNSPHGLPTRQREIIIVTTLRFGEQLPAVKRDIVFQQLAQDALEIGNLFLKAPEEIRVADDPVLLFVLELLVQAVHQPAPRINGGIVL
jgi:hypothetical protein